MTALEECVFCGCEETLETHWPCPALPDPQPDPVGGIGVDPEAERYSERVTLRVPKLLTDAIEALVDRGAYTTRSQAIRAAAFEAFVARARERTTAPTQMLPDGGAATVDALPSRFSDRTRQRYDDPTLERGDEP